MKFLFDLFPVILFFAVYKLADGNHEAAYALASRYLDGLAPAQAPVMLATAAGIVATVLQIAYLLARGRKVDGALWLSLGVIGVMGGATIYFHDQNFILWKPTILYWAFALALLVAQFGFRSNLVRKAMETQIRLPEPFWLRLNLAWVAFFVLAGAVNLLMAFVVFRDDMSGWVSFKLFGLTGGFLVFLVIQSLVLAKHIQEPGQEDA